MNILENIISRKKEEVAIQKKKKSVELLKLGPLYTKQPLSLRESLLDKNKTGIIAEFKRKSPSKGIINDSADVKAVTSAYASMGAAGISVLTDETFFGGSLEDLAMAVVNHLPVLRKDFMVDEYQVTEAKAYGASVILLIAACLSKQRVKELAIFAKDIGLEVLLEIHNDAELDHICDQVDLVGVNNRDLKTFQVDINISLDLIKKIPSSKIPITESGISDIEKILVLKKAGFCGFLIGENFMKHADPTVAFGAFVKALKERNEG